MKDAPPDAGRTESWLRYLHRPYASMNWIRFNGSLRHSRQAGHPAESQPLAGPPWWMP